MDGDFGGYCPPSFHRIALVMSPFYAFAASSEEGKFLHGPFAAVYRHYRGTTGMFLPKLAPPKSETTL